MEDTYVNQEQKLMSRSLGEHLSKYISKLEALEEEKAGIMTAIKEAFQEAKDDGVDIKALKELLKLRKMETMDLQEQQSTLRQYMQALGMYPN
jgi:uncharacterized protein (UPF0335 family)